MKNEIDYEVYCDGEWVAGSNDLYQAVEYVRQYREDGRVEVYEVKKSYTLVLKASKIKAAHTP